MAKQTKIIVFALILVGSISNILPQNYLPKSGYIPDSTTAIKVAEAVLFPIYGDSNIIKQRPYRICLVGDSIWNISGSSIRKNGEPFIRFGGNFHISLRKSDSRIIEVYHER